MDPDLSGEGRLAQAGPRNSRTKTSISAEVLLRRRPESLAVDVIPHAYHAKLQDEYHGVRRTLTIEEHRQAILSALAGTKIASDPELQKRLFDINVRLVLSPEASEFMKSYSPVTTAKAP